MGHSLLLKLSTYVCECVMEQALNPWTPEMRLSLQLLPISAIFFTLFVKVESTWIPLKYFYYVLVLLFLVSLNQYFDNSGEKDKI